MHLNSKQHIPCSIFVFSISAAGHLLFGTHFGRRLFCYDGERHLHAIALINVCCVCKTTLSSADILSDDDAWHACMVACAVLSCSASQRKRDAHLARARLDAVCRLCSQTAHRTARLHKMHSIYSFGFGLCLVVFRCVCACDRNLHQPIAARRTMMIIWSPWNPFNLYNDMVCGARGRVETLRRRDSNLPACRSFFSLVC